MSDDSDLYATASSARIDLTRDVDVAFWCRLLDVDHGDLRRAVQHVGPRADAVMRYLSAQAAKIGDKNPPTST